MFFYLFPSILLIFGNAELHFLMFWPLKCLGILFLKKEGKKKEEETFELFLLLVGHNNFFKTIVLFCSSSMHPLVIMDDA